MASTMRKLLLIAFALVALLAVPAVPAARPAADAGVRPAGWADRRREPFEDAVDRGLVYLVRAQNGDGSWGNGGGIGFAPPAWGGRPGPVARDTGDMAVTALAVMAFMSAGHVPGEGRYGGAVESGIRWVMARQQRDGRFTPQGGNQEMYYHGICTLMLAEATGMSSGASADAMRKELESAVRVLLEGQRRGGNGIGQNHAGGWRYQVTPGGGFGGFGGDSDLSVTGWQLMALRAAKNVGCDVPEANVKAAVEYVKRCHDARTGGYGYQAGGQPVTVPCTGVGILCLELSGKEYHLCDEVLKAGGYLLKNPLNARQPLHFYYGAYYTSQAMFQLGGNYWDSYRETLHRLLLKDNAPQQDGGWACQGIEAAYGSSYSTAMAVLALTVEYRYLPIYQRFEEPLERDGRE